VRGFGSAGIFDGRACGCQREGDACVRAASSALQIDDSTSVRYHWIAPI